MKRQTDKTNIFYTSYNFTQERFIRTTIITNIVFILYLNSSKLDFIYSKLKKNSFKYIFYNHTLRSDDVLLRNYYDTSLKARCL